MNHEIYKRTPVNIDLSDFLDMKIIRSITKKEQNICEGPLKETERLPALKTMKTARLGWVSTS